MIFVRDKGRLCNNILQYGHLYAWGREHDRQTMSMRFAYKYPYFHICNTRHHNVLTYLFAKYGAKLGLLTVVGFHEEGRDYREEELLLLKRKMVVAEGWYARWYDLFLKYKEEIVGLFAFKPTVKAPVDAMLSQLPVADIRLGVHVRRGDYRTWKGGRYCFSDAQYLAVIKRVMQLFPGQRTQVFVCGNDPELDKGLFRRELADVEVVFPDGNPGEDLYLLSKCDYLIGAPSTFSLTASMYHDTPLYWIMDADAPLTKDSFGHFDELFRNIQ